MRVARKIELAPEEEVKLTVISKGRRTSVRLAERAKIVLLAAQGKENQEIGETLGITRQNQLTADR
ncbi:MAG: helix-turn-helix domain-containing protein [Verrucomicrobia bacterium]|nr:helix-turn-helix domain-containing protein [Verrucomicrobiota bacterium]